jgi:hypothetical protein
MDLANGNIAAAVKYLVVDWGFFGYGWFGFNCFSSAV